MQNEVWLLIVRFPKAIEMQGVNLLSKCKTALAAKQILSLTHSNVTSNNRIKQCVFLAKDMNAEKWQ